jgi:hypothetical protein
VSGARRSRRWLAGAVAAAAAAACGDDRIAVLGSEQGVDYQRGAVLEAVAGFVAAGRTPEAYGALAAEIDRLRPGMDQAVAELAEVQLVVLALAPVEAVHARPPAEQVARLGASVWPVALAAPFSAASPDGWRNPRDVGVRRLADETADAYVRRMCDTFYAVACRTIVPEWQGAVLGAEAVERLADRARAAVANCESCDGDAWAAVLRRWEALELTAITERRQLEALGAASRWPSAGEGAAPWTELAAGPSVEIQPDGDWLLDGVALPPARRAPVLADLRAARPGATVLGVHLEPQTRAAELVEALEVAAAAGFAELAVAARASVYPWELRGYRFATAAGARPRGIRASETVQVVLRTFDVRAAAPARP